MFFNNAVGTGCEGEAVYVSRPHGAWLDPANWNQQELKVVLFFCLNLDPTQEQIRDYTRLNIRKFIMLIIVIVRKSSDPVSRSVRIEVKKLKKRLYYEA